MIRTILALTFAATMIAGAGAQPAKTAPAVAQPGKLSYAVAGSFAPFAFVRNGTLVGFDVEMGDELAKQLELQPNPLNIEFKGVIPALLGGRVDMINAAMFITEERAKQVEFVPYLRVGTEVVVTKTNPSKITGRDDSLCGKRIAVTLGGIQETYARADDARCKAAGKDSITVMTLPTAQDSLLTVRQGRADALFDSTPGAIKATTELPDVFMTVGTTFEAKTRLGYAVRKNDPQMKAAIEQALAAIVKSGRYREIMQKWALPATMSIFD
ncbi:ABC transporter substrate-binding protein [Bosea lathyri]|uniref:Amino acid ABC transporter substrate-binding protein, PAAT family n=1 Tax=Bosea lathyri TaxID=1036778 RepID=A0A1H6D9C4_9HYPH|nr:ABC transporter substrate-binding protein [Bosea lathyri]SEG81778.1 amino acid ABC transporter substrate-binding protein, PAAT family [Bosea lathyri]